MKNNAWLQTQTPDRLAADARFELGFFGILLTVIGLALLIVSFNTPVGPTETETIFGELLTLIGSIALIAWLVVRSFPSRI